MNESLPEFQNQRRRKKEVWADISKKLSDLGYCWTAEDCRKKWSNMVRTFKGIQEQKQDPTLSSKRIKWPFFEYMGELLALEGADFLPEATNIVQLLNSPMQAPSSPTAILSIKNNAHKIEQEQLSSNNLHQTDMVGVAVDLASIINSSSGEEITIGDSLRPVDMEQESLNVQEGSSRALLQQTPHRQQEHNLPLKTILKSGKRINGKRIKTAKSSISQDTSEALMQKILDMTNRNNEMLLGQLTSFQDNALELMQERNGILRRLCNVLEQSQEDSNSATNHNSFRYQEEAEPLETDPNQEPQPDQSEGTSYEIAGGTTLVSATNQDDGANIDLNGGIVNDEVAVVDPNSLHTLISQDSAGGLTFHLNVPNSSTSSENETHTRIVTDQKGHVRLENIPSDVNLSAFSATLPPYFVSVIPDSTKKPRFNLSKSVSVPMHRKIAPRK